MANLGQTNGLGKAAFFLSLPAAIDLKAVFDVVVSIYGGSCVHVCAYALCICVNFSTVHELHLF